MKLYTKNMDGSDIRGITYNSYWEHRADVSPGEKKICYFTYKWKNGDQAIRIANPDSSNETVISNSPMKNIQAGFHLKKNNYFFSFGTSFSFLNKILFFPNKIAFFLKKGFSGPAEI